MLRLFGLAEVRVETVQELIPLLVGLLQSCGKLGEARVFFRSARGLCAKRGPLVADGCNAVGEIFVLAIDGVFGLVESDGGI